MKNIIYLLLTALSANIVYSNPSDTIRKEVANYGAYVNYNLLFNVANFGSFPNYNTCCTNLTNSTGNGLSFGLLYNSSLIKQNDFQLRIGYNLKSSTFEEKENIGNIYDDNYNSIPAYSNHKAEISLSSISIQPRYLWNNLVGDLNTFAGINFSYLISGKFNQTETLESSNTNANYSGLINSKNWINLQDKQIDNLKLQVGLTFGFNYKLDLGSFILHPEISYNYNFIDVVDSKDWKMNKLSLGMSIQPVKIFEPIKQEIVEPKKDTIVIVRKTPIINVDLRVKGLDKDGNEQELAKYIVEEYLSKQIYPLLTYVFFDENSAQIPPRYISLNDNEINSFDENKRFFNSTAMDAYYNLLNIVGSRMMNKPNSKINLVGCNYDRKVEKNNLNLSERRAESVKNYLVNRWKINPENITIQSRNLSEKYSRGELKEHYEENRRVEIYSDDFDIIKPVIVYDTLRLSNPPKVKFKAKAYSNIGVTDWQIDVSQSENNTKKQFLKTNGTNNLDTTFLWQLKKKQSIPSNENDLEFKLTVNQVSDKFDTTITVEGKIPVELITVQKKRQRRIKDKYIDEYRLIMFDHNSANVSILNEKIIELICSNLTNESSIVIKGSTDYLGNVNDNIKLSVNRANSVKNNFKCNPQNIVSEGNGHNPLYDEDTPEGRFYCRTVEVTVETPIKD